MNSSLTCLEYDISKMRRVFKESIKEYEYWIEF